MKNILLQLAITIKTSLGISLCLLAGFLMVFTEPVFAITADQRQVFDGGVNYFDLEEGERKKYTPPAPGGGGGVPGGPLVGCDNAQKVYNFFIAAGLTPIQAVGIMGNLQAESHFDPAITEIGNGIGFGIAQWSFGRRTSLEDEARAAGIDPADLSFQLGYLVRESKNRESVTNPNAPNEWEGLKMESTVEGATTYWEANFERPAVAGQQIRIDFANDLLLRFGSGGGC